MRYKNIEDETIFDRLLATRLGDLGTYVRRRMTFDTIPQDKYERRRPEGFETTEVERIAYAIRGEDYRPAIFIHGVLPRSGTNYLADLFEHHAEVRAHPHRFWEFPLLSITDEVMQLQNDFARAYPTNAEVLKPYEFCACLNSGLMKYLQELAGERRTMLLKFPFVHHLDLFRTLFPKDYLVLLLRDGRDVVASSLKTFQGGLIGARFSRYCKEWRSGARTILEYESDAFDKDPRTLVVRFEDLFSDPGGSMQKILGKTGLAPDTYDFSQLGKMPIRGSSEMAEQPGGVNWQPWKPPGGFNPVGRWQDWPERRKQKFKAIAGDTLIASGYESNDDW